jgi:hypothetical protein
MTPIIPEVADLVILFKSDATEDQINNFWDETLSTRQGTGSWPRPGTSGIARIGYVQGHVVVAVSFSPSATEAQREDIKSRVKSSPIVYKVMENVPQSKIDKIE